MMSFPTKTARVAMVSYSAGVLVASAHEAEVQLPFQYPHAHESIEGHAHLGWMSRYHSEGRDSLDGDSLFAGSVELGWRHLAGGVWYGHSPDQDYDECQISLALNGGAGDLEYYLGYTHLRFPFDGSHDNEIGIGATWQGLPLEIELAADAYHSFAADGCFAEISVAREFLVSEKLSLHLSGVFGVNQGYVSDGHDGANHFALRLGVEYALSESLSLTAHTAYSWGLERDRSLAGDALLDDFLHGGVGLQWSF